MLQANTYQIQKYSETPLADLLNEMSESREEFSNPEPKTEPPANEVMQGSSNTETEPVTKPPVTEPVPVDPAEIKNKRDYTARQLAKWTDQGMAFVCALIADDDDSDIYKADAQDKKDLVECYFNMCEGYGWVNMPPWLTLVFCLSFTYGPKIQTAFKERRVNQAITRKAAQAEAEKAIAERKLRDAKLENERLKAEALENKKAPEKTETVTNDKPDGTDGKK